MNKLKAFLLLSITFIVSDVIKLGSYDVPLSPMIIEVRYVVVFAFLLMFCTMKRLSYGRGIALTDLVWVGFGVAITVSACINADTEGIITGLWTLFIVPIVFGRILPCILSSQGIGILNVALLASGLPYIAYSLFMFPIDFPYMGATQNSNSFGIIATGTTTALIAKLVATRNKKQPLMRFIVLVSALISAGLVVASASRTSCIACLCVVSVAAATCIPKLIHKPGLLIVIVTLLALGGVTTATILSDGSVQAVAAITLKFDKGLNDRDQIWAKVWQERSAFGYGCDYFNIGAAGIGGSAHNSIVDMLGKYGVLAAMGSLALAVSSLYATASFYWRNRNREAHALTPLLITLCFWILSGAETMLGPIGGSINLSLLIAIGMTNLLPKRNMRICLTKCLFQN